MHSKIDPFKEKLLYDSPWPKKALSWPQSRTLKEYCNLVLEPWPMNALTEEPKLPEIITFLALAWIANKPTEILDPDDFLKRINPQGKPIIVDIGVGDAYALKELKESEGFITVGLTVHEINPINAPFIDLLGYSPVPNGPVAQRIFHYLRGKVALVCEAFGASTYASNPIEALIFEGLLLAPGGVAKLIVSSVPQEEREQSPLGFALQRQRLEQFFKNELGLSLIISRTYIKSLVIPGSYCVDYHVEIKRELQSVVSDKSLEELFILAKTQIGQCTVLPKNSLAGVFDDEFDIRARSYTRRGEDIQREGIKHAKELKDLSFRFDEAENACPSFNLSFNSDEVLNDFTICFAEYYLNNKQKTDWSLTKTSNCSVVLTYTGMRQDRIEAIKQARIEINQVSPGLLSDSWTHRLFQPYSTKFTEGGCDLTPFNSSDLTL